MPILHQAAGQGRTDRIRIALSLGVDPHEEYEGNTALHVACMRGHVKAAYVLVEAGCDINAVGEAEWTPCTLAILGGHTNLVKYLLRKGVPLHFRDSNGATLLHAAAFFGQVDIARLLVEAGAELLALDRSGVSPLLQGANAGHVDMIRFLLRCGDDPSEPRGHSGLTALHGAAEAGFPKAVRALLQLSADETVLDAGGMRPIDRVIDSKFTRAIDMNTMTLRPPPDARTKKEICRLLERGPAFRAMSWVWPVRDWLRPSCLQPGPCAQFDSGVEIRWRVVGKIAILRSMFR